MKSVFSRLTLGVSLAMAITLPVQAGSLALTSSDIADGKTMPKAQEFNGFGCSGDNISPQLSWSGAPVGTKAYALMVHDPDAPTGGAGFWHWQLLNIPGTVSSLASGAGAADGKRLPFGGDVRKNDYGLKGFGGACPPEGHGPHRYRFTLYALPKVLEIPAQASAAVVGFMVEGSALEKTTLEALYQR
ncbi:YbhB/YbcL family Raf kinase inhibitor-like protein [Oceanobacter mangrovi]|uniref:YbhB/YbcL family Raf kinase inhibitor-like protein n=1 Tax=Oceanobacter mangrovi TaxID=2862510 RepID=UPI001C8D9386|nr:YbhB/YbcL family Raf kinase inhibitor-like protein [Oceanobacter mangrovi]